MTQKQAVEKIAKAQ